MNENEQFQILVLAWRKKIIYFYVMVLATEKLFHQEQLQFW